LHRCVRFHDTEYAVYGDAADDGCTAEELTEANEGGEDEEGEGAEGEEESLWSATEIHRRMPPPEAARGGSRAGSADPFPAD
jgi:hypothetical protein